MPIKTDSIPLW